MKMSSNGACLVRIVGGKYAGRDLLSPADARVRPTAELVRAGMMDMLGKELQDARVLAGKPAFAEGEHRHPAHAAAHAHLQA
jgi:hypothetical protein